MKTIYLDSDFCCHITNDGTMTEVETDVFDGKCNAYIEGFRFVPSGETWVRSDGEVFHGEMVAPFTNYAVLSMIQKQYMEDQTQMEDMANALAILGVSP